MILTITNFDGVSAAEQEGAINHLQHSPLPFGEIEEPLSPDMTIDPGITHKLDGQGGSYNQVNYAGPASDYTFTRNNNGTVTVVSEADGSMSI